MKRKNRKIKRVGLIIFEDLFKLLLFGILIQNTKVSKLFHQLQPLTVPQTPSYSLKLFILPIQNKIL